MYYMELRKRYHNLGLDNKIAKMGAAILFLQMTNIGTAICKHKMQPRCLPM